MARIRLSNAVERELAVDVKIKPAIDAINKRIDELPTGGTGGTGQPSVNAYTKTESDAKYTPKVVPAPTADTDAVNKAYVDANGGDSGLGFKPYAPNASTGRQYVDFKGDLSQYFAVDYNGMLWKGNGVDYALLFSAGTLSQRPARTAELNPISNAYLATDKAVADYVKKGMFIPFSSVPGRQAVDFSGGAFTNFFAVDYNALYLRGSPGKDYKLTWDPSTALKQSPARTTALTPTDGETLATDKSVADYVKANMPTATAPTDASNFADKDLSNVSNEGLRKIVNFSISPNIALIAPFDNPNSVGFEPPYVSFRYSDKGTGNHVFNVEFMRLTPRVAKQFDWPTIERNDVLLAPLLDDDLTNKKYVDAQFDTELEFVPTDGTPSVRYKVKKV